MVRALRTRVRSHILEIGLDSPSKNGHLLAKPKELIRATHAAQRADLIGKERAFLAAHAHRLLGRFAYGHEVVPERISPRLIEVRSGTEDGNLFRLATALWSVPVSRGYGRRMRFLVVDGQNDKLIGLFALGDPVFNMRVRDQWIGWDAKIRAKRLVNVMDAYVVGAVPPYSQLLGGKLVTSLIGSDVVSSRFEARYAGRVGEISKEVKNPKLALVTVTSALGRSSIYNRVKLAGLVELVKLGSTNGWGHFHVSDDLFQRMRALLAHDQHKYASGHQYGDGPNWKIRVIREALERIGMDGDLLRHGIAREVFAMPLADNFKPYLRGETDELLQKRQTVCDITTAALQRWMVPRADRNREFLVAKPTDLLYRLGLA